MTTVAKYWTFGKLPEEAQEHLKTVHLLSNVKRYRQGNSLATSASASGGGLFAAFEEVQEEARVPAQEKVAPVLWATEDYEARGRAYGFKKPLHDLSVIKPRVEKAQAEQKRRVKQKAEVFTPAWVVNLQNNLIDDSLLGEGSFNRPLAEDEKQWVSSQVVPFTAEMPWWRYVASRRLELCCGEGPYLFTPYDAAQGISLPVRTPEGRWQRVGLLDRKLRVVSEHATSQEEWLLGAQVAVDATYGYEWQGDSLLLARLNLVNTVFDYLMVFLREAGLPKPGKSFLSGLVVAVAEQASWQLWQMDGLKQVVPATCSSKCGACAKGKRTGHDGLLPLLRWGKTAEGYHLRTFESFLPE